MAVLSRPRSRGRLLLLSSCAAALLVAAPAASADTKVSIEDGDFANGAGPGRYILIKDINSVTHNEPLDVTATRVGSQLHVTDAAGDEVPGDNQCSEVGATVRCPLTGVLGLRFEGSQLNDVLVNDTNLLANFHGFQGTDQIAGGSIRDEVAGGIGNDDMSGGDGNDVFTASDAVNDGADDVEGDGGVDLMHYGLSDDAVSVDLSPGPDEEGDDIRTENVTGSAFADTLTGNLGANTINGGAGGDEIDGSVGDDHLVGGAGPDDFACGSGVDAVSYADQTAAVTVGIDQSDNDGNANDGSSGNRDLVGTDVENVLGGSGPDALSAGGAGNAANRLVGNGDDDVITGFGGPDRLEGGAGEDNMNGQDGDDTLLGGADGDSLSGASGDDTLEGEAGDDLLFGATDDDVLRGGADKDTLSASEGDDILEGGTADDSLHGFTGSDVVDGGTGIDLAQYGTHGPVEVTLDDGLRNDGGTADEVNGKRDELRLVEHVTGTLENDVMTGDGDGETLNGGGGHDVLNGEGGADILIGGPQNDTLTGGPGVDEFRGETGDDLLDARDGAQDQPISCGEDIGDLDVDVLKADLEDLFSPTVADCEEIELP
jgi:Ca2+-binding RTX toxin-like protein